jgi:4-carboxymuconolactone decarboxylase
MAEARPAIYDLVPKLGELRDKVLFGDVWEDPALSKRDRSLITVAVLIALYRSGELPGHLRRALNNGVTREEIGAVITHLAFYAGWPTAANAVRIAKDVFDQAKRPHGLCGRRRISVLRVRSQA